MKEEQKGGIYWGDIKIDTETSEIERGGGVKWEGYEGGGVITNLATTDENKPRKCGNVWKTTKGICLCLSLSKSREKGTR